jgi:hypothetical protein
MKSTFERHSRFQVLFLTCGQFSPAGTDSESEKLCRAVFCSHHKTERHNSPSNKESSHCRTRLSPDISRIQTTSFLASNTDLECPPPQVDRNRGRGSRCTDKQTISVPLLSPMFRSNGNHIHRDPSPLDPAMTPFSNLPLDTDLHRNPKPKPKPTRMTFSAVRSIHPSLAPPQADGHHVHCKLKARHSLIFAITASMRWQSHPLRSSP